MKKTQEVFIKLQSGFEVYAEWTPRFSKPGEEATPLVFLNGLGDSMMTWQNVATFFEKDYSTLYVDLIGQGQSLSKGGGLTGHDFRIGPEVQSQALDQVLKKLGLAGPIVLLGYSYGGGVALDFANRFADKIEKLILVLPYLIRLDFSFPWPRFWGRQMQWMRSIPGPTQIAIDLFDRSYQKFLHEYMHQRYRERIPGVELREVAIQLSEGIMDFEGLSALRKLQGFPVHLISSERDTLNPRSLYQEAWANIPEDVTHTWLKIEDCSHLVLEEAPLFLANWLEMLIEDSNPVTGSIFKAQALHQQVKAI